MIYLNALMSGTDYHYRKLYEVFEEVKYLRQQINLICKRMGIKYQINNTNPYDPKNVYNLDPFFEPEEIWSDGIFGEHGLEDNSKKHTNVLNYNKKKK